MSALVVEEEEEGEGEGEEMVVVGFEIWYLLMWSRLAREKVFFISILPPLLWSMLHGVCKTELFVCSSGNICLFVCWGSGE